MNRPHLNVCVLALVALTASALAGCSDRHSDFSQFKDIPPEGWAYGDTVCITASGLDSTDVRSLYASVRHSGDYLYRNLWLEVSYTGSDHRLRRDTVELELADIYGRWLGNGFGPSYQMEVPVSTAAPIADSTQVKVRHIMRVDTLMGVQQVGILIKPSDPGK